MCSVIIQPTACHVNYPATSCHVIRPPLRDIERARPARWVSAHPVSFWPRHLAFAGARRPDRGSVGAGGPRMLAGAGRGVLAGRPEAVPRHRRRARWLASGALRRASQNLPGQVWPITWQRRAGCCLAGGGCARSWLVLIYWSRINYLITTCRASLAPRLFTGFIGTTTSSRGWTMRSISAASASNALRFSASIVVPVVGASDAAHRMAETHFGNVGTDCQRGSAACGPFFSNRVTGSR